MILRLRNTNILACKIIWWRVLLEEAKVGHSKGQNSTIWPWRSFTRPTLANLCKLLEVAKSWARGKATNVRWNGLRDTSGWLRTCWSRVAHSSRTNMSWCSKTKQANGKKVQIVLLTLRYYRIEISRIPSITVEVWTRGIQAWKHIYHTRIELR